MSDCSAADLMLPELATINGTTIQCCFSNVIYLLE